MHTARLELRPLSDGNLDDLVELDGFAMIRDVIDPFGDLIPSARARRDYERRLIGRTDFQGAVELGSGRFVGWFQVEAVGGPRSEVELGYRLRPDMWGRGYATEGAAALLAAAVGRPDVPRVYAHALLSNPASIRVMEKIGMSYVRPWDYRGLAGVEYEARPA
jgi:RimJ/RimL family protein N-acetyltransferase